MPHLKAATSLLLIVDMQDALLPAIPAGGQLVERVARLARSAALLGVPVMATEHCPDKIGATVEALHAFPAWVQRKTHFDATREAGFLQRLGAAELCGSVTSELGGNVMPRPQVLLVGTEAHVCVLQTGLGLYKAGFQPVLVKNGIGSRDAEDHQVACERWAHHGLEIVTAEMAMFEWLESADHPGFREVLALVKAV